MSEMYDKEYGALLQVLLNKEKRVAPKNIL